MDVTLARAFTARKWPHPRAKQAYRVNGRSHAGCEGHKPYPRGPSVSWISEWRASGSLPG
jgi:hypothetical protein